MAARFHQVIGGIRHYAWGQRASGGRVPYIPAWLGVPADEEPWAELWLGAHPSLPSAIKGEEAPLDCLIADAPAYWCGVRGELPFLLKLLACERPLSIQSHPDRETAARLHAQNPAAYPDSNDKTEILIALEPFEAMAGFRNAVMAREDMARVQALGPWLEAAKPADGMRGLVTALFAMPSEAAAALVDACAAELMATPAETRRPSEALFLRLAEACPGDRGALFAFLLNHLRLEAGEACFLPPNTPHAYLRGVGLECMTNSDNVIRAGLTPKLIDVPNMLATLDFKRSGVTLMKPSASSARTFAPPGASFQVSLLEDTGVDLAALPPELAFCVVLEGRVRLMDAAGKILEGARGTAWLRPAALATGSIEPLVPGTRFALATVQ